MRNFLSKLQTVLPEERNDIQIMSEHLGSCQCLVVFQPAIIGDFLPMTVLKNEGILQEARKEGKELVWLVPTGDSLCHFHTDPFESVLSNFYIDDELPDLKVPKQIEGLEIEEMLLLYNESIPNYYRIPGFDRINVVYVSLSAPDGLNVYAFVCAGSPDQVWNAWTVQAQCGIDWLIDSNKGMGECFARSDLLRRFMAFDRKSLLPPFYVAGLYTDYDDLPETFYCFKTVKMIGRKTFRFFLCPWGHDNAYTESIIRKEQEAEKKLEQWRADFTSFKKDLSAQPPLPVLRHLYAFLREQIKKDGSVSDFYQINEMPFYNDPNETDDDDADTLGPRVELFAVVTALSLFEETSHARERAFSDMNAIVQYHIERSYKSRLTNAYIFSGADSESERFFSAIYDDVKCFSSERTFAIYIASFDQNPLEEALLRTAYKRKDYEYADWLIENQFCGRLQPELYYIICQYDRDKADEIAKRLSPSIIAVILKDYLHSRRQSLSQNKADQVIATDQNDPNIDPLNRIFRSISKEKACTVRNSMSSKEPLSWNLYLKLMEKYFGECVS